VRLPKKSKAKIKRKPLYRSSKISDYRFQKVLWHFVRDHSVALTATETRLSANSVTAIFRKLRIYFFEVGLFTDFYEGSNPLEITTENEVVEFLLLDYHLTRLRDKRGMKIIPGEPDYHFAESHWRFQFRLLMDQRSAEGVYNMMHSHLLEIIRACGPIGAHPQNVAMARRIRARQLDQRVSWLMRNSPEFRSEKFRVMLKEIRDIEIED
jgi:hypothetical protein